MARLFDDGASEYLERAAQISAVPFTLACWLYTDDLTTDQSLMYIGDTASGNNFWDMSMDGASAGDAIRFRARDAGGNTVIGTAASAIVGTWHHACAVAAADDDRAVYLDGGSKATSAANRSPAGIDVVAIGRHSDNVPDQYMSGRIAEAVILNIAATDYQVWLHAQGVPAPIIWPGWAIVSYYPLFETDRDFPTGNYNMTPYNTPGWAPHPPKVLEYWRRYKVRAVTTQTTQARIAPWVWVDWSPEGIVEVAPEPVPDITAYIAYRKAWKSQDD
jgi:hypothetical protein